MVSWGFVRNLVRFTLVIAVIYVGWVFLSRYRSHHNSDATPDPDQARRNAEFARTYGGTQVKILQFYAREGNLTQGSPTVLCYGVLNARSVRIDPPVEGVSPALSRCVEISPTAATRYTLTAEGSDGHTATESFVLQVTADQTTLPRIGYFRVDKDKLEGGRHIFTLAFACKNGEEISIDPPVFPTLHGAPNGQFSVSPDKTTTYTLTVTGKFGHKAQKTLTIQVPGS
ncbi:MAG TPA: hypothetical protein VG456_16065 [Candidatus Sulfopaludibacter sp.]|jgi:hypothetical protein|nr:hypothetical protein [Candidatus Sulfopaludibacter sp.]